MNNGAAPTHPGELMAEILRDHVKLSVAEAATRMEVTRRVLNGSSAVSAPMASKFGKLVGADPRLYLAMQAERDLWFFERLER